MDETCSRFIEMHARSERRCSDIVLRKWVLARLRQVIRHSMRHAMVATVWDGNDRWTSGWVSIRLWPRFPFSSRTEWHFHTILIQKCDNGNVFCNFCAVFNSYVHRANIISVLKFAGDLRMHGINIKKSISFTLTNKIRHWRVPQSA